MEEALCATCASAILIWVKGLAKPFNIFSISSEGGEELLEGFRVGGGDLVGVGEKGLGE